MSETADVTYVVIRTKQNGWRDVSTPVKTSDDRKPASDYARRMNKISKVYHYSVKRTTKL